VATSRDKSAGDEQRGALLSRLYSQKVVIVLLALALLTMAFIIAAYRASASDAPRWLQRIPWESLVVATAPVVLMGFGYEYVVREESAARLRNLFAHALAAQTDALATAIPKSLAARPEALSSLSVETLDDLAASALGARLQQPELAAEWYRSAVAQLARHEHHQRNYRCKITLETPIKRESAAVRHLYFDAHVHLRYEATLYRTHFTFSVVPDSVQYERRQFAGDELTAIAEPTPELPILDERVFRMKQVRVNGIKLVPMEPQSATHGRYSFAHDDLDALVGRDVVIEYSYQLKLQKLSHTYVQYIQVPTRGVAIEFDVSGVDVAVVNTFDFFVSQDAPLIRTHPSPSDPRKVEVELNEWVLPKSGVLFAWVLEREGQDPTRLPAA
jgi:hypothetical protein